MVWGQDLEPGSRVRHVLFIGADPEGSLEQACSGLHRALWCQSPGIAMGKPRCCVGEPPAPVCEGGLWSPGEVVQEWLSFYREDLQHFLTGTWHHVNSGRSSGELRQNCAVFRAVSVLSWGLTAELWVPLAAAKHCVEAWLGTAGAHAGKSHVM